MSAPKISTDQAFADGQKKVLRTKGCPHRSIDMTTLGDRIAECPDCGAYIDAQGRNRDYEVRKTLADADEAKAARGGKR